jgi:dipeptidyl aminopeptidase/acylaminoacyl peptidase
MVSLEAGLSAAVRGRQLVVEMRRRCFWVASYVAARAGWGVLLTVSVFNCARAVSAGSSLPNLGYRYPPEEMINLLESPPLPEATASPDGRWIILTEQQGAPSVRDMEAPDIQVLGSLIDPKTHAPPSWLAATGIGMRLISTQSGQETTLSVPDSGLSVPLWSPDSRQFLFRHTGAASDELWIGDIQSQEVRRVPRVRLSTLESPSVPCMWMHDRNKVLCNEVPELQGEAPRASVPGLEPIVEDTGVRESYSSSSSLLDTVLRNAQDAALFEYYFTSQPMVIDLDGDERVPLGVPGIYDVLEPSPDGQYFVSMRTVRPYALFAPNSYVFPKRIEILDARGNTLHALAEREVGTFGSLAGGWAVPGPRRFAWVPGSPSTLVYIEALDGGDPGRHTDYRDRLMRLVPPFTGPPVELVRTRGRMSAAREGPAYYWDNHGANIAWLQNGVAWMDELDLGQGRKRSWKVQVLGEPSRPQLLLDVGSDSRLSNEGGTALPVGGHLRGSLAGNGSISMLERIGNSVYLVGDDPSRNGARPFLKRFDLATHKSTTVFQSAPTAYETALDLLDATHVLTRHETPTQPPNYYIRDIVRNTFIQITHLESPGKESAGLRPQLIHYVRSDGVLLSGELYLPEGVIPPKPLPTLIWAYPHSYIHRDAAGEVATSANQYALDESRSTRFLTGIRALATQGYAVLWDAAMPLIEINGGADTTVQQLTASAQAAVKALVEMGVANPQKIAIAGQSFGGTMTGILLANTDLFAAGISIDGCFNWSREPFGFQYERRTLWEAPSAYISQSPYFKADQIHAPLLLVHGARDPVFNVSESEQMYQALNGLGRTARLAILPYEGHTPEGKESIEDLSWETLNWLNRYLKGRADINVASKK